jgi:hypothetical protein
MKVEAQIKAEEIKAIVPAPSGNILDSKKEKMPYPPFRNMTDLVVTALFTAFSYDCNVVQACAYADISTSYYYEFIKAYPKFVDTFERARSSPAFKARMALVESFPARPELALRYLESTDEAYNPKRTIKHEGEVAINFSLELKERIKQYEPRPIEATAVEVSSPDVAEVERGA